MCYGMRCVFERMDGGCSKRRNEICPHVLEEIEEERALSESEEGESDDEIHR